MFAYTNTQGELNMGTRGFNVPPWGWHLTKPLFVHCEPLFHVCGGMPHFGTLCHRLDI